MAAVVVEVVAFADEAVGSGLLHRQELADTAAQVQVQVREPYVWFSLGRQVQLRHWHPSLRNLLATSARSLL